MMMTPSSDLLRVLHFFSYFSLHFMTQASTLDNVLYKDIVNQIWWHKTSVERPHIRMVNIVSMLISCCTPLFSGTKAFWVKASLIKKPQ